MLIEKAFNEILQSFQMTDAVPKHRPWWPVSNRLLIYKKNIYSRKICSDKSQELLMNTILHFSAGGVSDP